MLNAVKHLGVSQCIALRCFTSFNMTLICYDFNESDVMLNEVKHLAVH